MQIPFPNYLYVFLCGVLAVAVGCTPATPSGTGGPAEPEGPTLLFGRASDSPTLDPANAEDGESVKVIVNLFDTLVAYEEDGIDLVPGLATEWEISPDGLEYLFHLREGVTFHDGTPLTPDAVTYTFARMLDPEHPENASLKVPYRESFDVIESVEAVGPMSVRFRLSRPYSVFLANLAMFPASIVSRNPDAANNLVERNGLVGTGPFQFEEWLPKQRLSIVAFPKHWRGAPKAGRIVFLPIPEPSARLRQLRSGEIDLTDNLSVPVRQQVRQDSQLQLLTRPGMNVAYFSMNTQHPPFDDPRVRRAVAHALDKREIQQLGYEGEGEIAVNPLPRTLWGHNDELESLSYDLSEAKRLLAEAGIEPGTRVSFWHMNNARPYMPSPGNVAAYVAQQLRELGFEVEIQSPDWAQYLDKVGQGEHDACLLGWTSDNADPDNFLFALLDKTNAVPPNAHNVSFYESDELHELLAKAQEVTDREERADLYRKAQVVIHRDAPMVPLMHLDLAIATRPGVRHRIHPTGIVWLRDTTIVPE